MIALPQILIAVLIVDIAVIFMVRYFPQIFGKPINDWYDQFGLSAVMADVLVIVLGILIAQYIIRWTGASSLPILLATVVAVQLIHDILFYFFVIRPIPKGTNGMIDLFKTYAEGGQSMILVADAAMIVGSVLIASVLQSAPAHVTAFTGVLAAYTLPYILATRPQYPMST
jgi:hypothetical protein